MLTPQDPALPFFCEMMAARNAATDWQYGPLAAAKELAIQLAALDLPTNSDRREQIVSIGAALLRARDELEELR